MPSDEQPSEWGLVEPFDVDNGELDGLAPNLIFCMGAEYMQVRADILKGEPFDRTVMTPNASRIKRMCIRHKRRFKIEPWAEHPDQWHFLSVAGEDGEFNEKEGA